MLEFVVEQAELVKGLTAISRIAKNKLNDILQNVKITKLNDNAILLVGSDISIAIQYEVPVAKVEGDGILYNINELLAIISRLDGIVSINNGLIRAKSSKFKIQHAGIELYPELDFKTDIDLVNIDAKELSNALSKTVYACSYDNGVLSGVYFDNDNIVATDASRLVINHIDNIGLQTIMPKNLCEEILRLFNDGMATIQLDKNKVFISNEKIVLVGNTIFGNYPKYKALLPKEFKYEVQFKKSNFINALNTLMPLFDNQFMICQLDINKCDVMVHGDNGNSTGETELTLEDSNIEEPLSICFNVHFLMDMLKNYDEDVKMQFNSILSATVFTDNLGRYSLIMPIQKK